MQVIIITRNHRITGEVTIAPGERLTDYLVEAKNFIAVTNAEIATLEGHPLLVTPFLNVHRDHVEIVLPFDLAQVIP
jgi:hypothetical protein